MTSPKQKSTATAEPRTAAAWIWLIAWLSLGVGLFYAATPGGVEATAIATATAPVENGYPTTNIEDLRPGDLVLAMNPETERPCRNR